MKRPTLSQAPPWSHPRGQYVVQGLLALGILSAGVWGVMLSIDNNAQAQAMGEANTTSNPDTGLDESTYFAVDRLRNELSLTQSDLRALGCNGDTVVACLATLLDWYRTNQAVLHTARNNVLAAKEVLYEAHCAVPRSDAWELEALTRDFVDARQALEAVQDQLIRVIGASMTVEQRRCWAAGRGNTGLSGPLRYVPQLTDDQKIRIHSAQAEGLDLPGVIRRGDLTYRQQQTAKMIHTAMSAPAAAVVLAEESVLPLPESLRLDHESVPLHEQTD